MLRLDKPLIFALALLPLGLLVWSAVFDQLGANPAQALVRASGDWTLRMLCLVLALTPLRVQFKLPMLARWRRMLGLLTYFYALLHLLSYAWFDMGLVGLDIVKDIAKRPFILVGFTAFVLLSVLALTSFDGAIKWLGAKRWQRLHRLIYLVAGLAVLHFFWLRAAKRDLLEVAVYGALLAALLFWRWWRWRRKKRQQMPGD